MKDYIRLLKFLKPHLLIFAVAVFSIIAFSLFEKATLGAVIPLVDNVLSGRQIVIPRQQYVPPAVLGFVDKINSMGSRSKLELALWIVGIGTALMLLREIFSFLKSYFMYDLSERVVRDIKDCIYGKFLDLSLDYYSRNPTGRLVSRITYDALLVRDSISTAFLDLIEQPAQILLSGVVVGLLKFYFDISWMLLFLSMIFVPAILYPVRQLGKKLKKLSKQSQEKMGDINVTLYEAISGIRIVKAFSMEPYEKARFRKDNQQFYKLSMKAIKRIEIISPMSECAIILCVAFIAAAAGRDIVGGALSAGAFLAFLAAFMLMAKPAKRLARVYGVLQTALAAGRRIFEVIDEEPAVMEKPGAVALLPFRNKIAFENVSFKYENIYVLKNVSFEAKKGDIIALVGPSGAGKTTLVNLIPRFYDATEGSIKIDGLCLKDVTLRSLRDNIGLVTQDTILFNDTVSANISYGMAEKVHREEVINAAKIANAHDFIMRLPKGYDTIVGEKGFRLSGGEKQRLAIGRAVFKNPPILILDEATSQLDSDSEAVVQSAIDRLMKSRTVFVIAHRLSTVKNATKILVLDRGAVVEEGTHAELMEKAGLYRRLYDMQFIPKE